MATNNVNVHVCESDRIEAVLHGEGEDASSWIRIGWGTALWIDGPQIAQLRKALDDLERMQSVGMAVAS